MKIISWNVNGLRAVIRKNWHIFLKNERPAIICLQEIKISDHHRADIELDSNLQDYLIFWNCARRPGYSGTAILVDKNWLKLSKIKTDSLIYKSGIGIEKFDVEGRVQTLELPKFYLVNTYFPNSNHELSRLGYKLDFNDALLKYLKKLSKKKPIVLTGDYNVAHKEIDLARPKENIGNPGFTEEERIWMDKFIKAGFIDTFRLLNGNKIQYSWWSFRASSRARNVGWRIDYFCVSDKLKKNIDQAFILDKVVGSDHAPVGIEIK